MYDGRFIGAHLRKRILYRQPAALDHVSKHMVAQILESADESGRYCSTIGRNLKPGDFRLWFELRTISFIHG